MCMHVWMWVVSEGVCMRKRERVRGQKKKKKSLWLWECKQKEKSPQESKRGVGEEIKFVCVIVHVIERERERECLREVCSSFFVCVGGSKRERERESSTSRHPSCKSTTTRLIVSESLSTIGKIVWKWQNANISTISHKRLENKRQEKKAKSETTLWFKIWIDNTLYFDDLLQKKKLISTSLKINQRLGSVAQRLAYLLTDQATPGLIPSISEIFSEDKIVNVAEVNQR